MVRIWEGNRQGIAEYRGSIMKRDAVFLGIGTSFLLVPFEFHSRPISYAQSPRAIQPASTAYRNT